MCQPLPPLRSLMASGSSNHAILGSTSREKIFYHSPLKWTFTATNVVPVCFHIAIAKRDEMKKLSWAAGLLGCQVFMGNSVLGGYHVLSCDARHLIIWTKSLLVLICDLTRLYQTPKKPIYEYWPSKFPSSHWGEEGKRNNMYGEAALLQTVREVFPVRSPLYIWGNGRSWKILSLSQELISESICIGTPNFHPLLYLTASETTVSSFRKHCLRSQVNAESRQGDLA